MANIIWMPSAKDTYAEILKKLELETALKFDEKVEELIDKLRSFVNFCPPSEKIPSIRKCVINKQIALIYSADKTTVYLIAFYYNKSSVFI